jgi:hypothetical protein
VGFNNPLNGFALKPCLASCININKRKTTNIYSVCTKWLGRSRNVADMGTSNCEKCDEDSKLENTFS